jgi:hypothetical protein
MATVSPLDVSPNFQYDADSAPNQAYNCGPTTITNIVKYHRDLDFGINDTRRLAVTTNYRGTNSGERKLMLLRRGVACSIRSLTGSQVKSLLTNRRVIELALKMNYIPRVVRLHGFTGTHSVAALANTYSICPVHQRTEPGIWVFDPNFRRGDEPAKRRIFYPDHYWIPAFVNYGGWAVVPDADKVITTRVAWRKTCTVLPTDGLVVRSGPGTNYSRLGLLARGSKFTSIELEKAGSSYTASGVGGSPAAS